jgi:uncharacterized protein YqcC (DUF446 family)
MNPAELHARVADLLLDIEAELRRLDLWQGATPPIEALASRMPFCCDTLDFCAWLQFVLLGRMKQLIEAGAQLPDNCGIAPMAEEYFRFVTCDTARLLAILERMDATLSGMSERLPVLNWR